MPVPHLQYTVNATTKGGRMDRRCVCGRSRRFPVCDGSHTEKGWSCAPAQVKTKDTVILSVSHYLSLAEKWSYRLGAIHSSRVNEMLRCNDLWIICDGTDFERLLVEKERILAARIHLVAIGCDPISPKPKISRRVWIIWTLTPFSDL